jgi:hypothetical protein
MSMVVNDHNDVESLLSEEGWRIGVDDEGDFVKL